MKKVFTIIKNRWAEYLIEILVIVLGITLSFLLSEWRNNIQNRQTEILALEGIRDNLDNDTLLLKNRIVAIKWFVHSSKQLLSYDEKVLDSDSLILFVDALNTYSTFKNTNIGYEELRQTGNSKHITNKQLLKKIIQFYETKAQFMEEWNLVDQNFILEKILPYSLTNLEYAKTGLFHGIPSIIRLLKQDDKFKNLIQANHMFKKIILMIYQQILTENLRLMEEINRELKHLK